jgi:subtilisin family serine protease
MRRTRRTLTPALVALVVVSFLVASPPAEAAPSGRYIVTISSGSGSVANALARLVRVAGGGRVVQTYEHALQGGVVELSPGAARVLGALPGVTAVEPDGVMSLSITNQTNPPSYGINRIDQRNLPLDGVYAYTSTGSGVKVYVIDTGIRATHSTFGGRAIAGANTVDSSPSTQDCNGHGTHVAGTVGGSSFGVAKSVMLVSVRVFGCSNSTLVSAIVAGVDWVVGDHLPGQPAVANLSLGGGASTTLDSAVRRMIADGVTTVMAAGNDGGNGCSTTSPGRVTEGITTGATDASDNRASFSNYGSCVDLHAPGVSIVSAGAASDTASATMSGTSMATPHVAGAAARYLSRNTTASPAQVQTALVSSSTPGVVRGIKATCTFIDQLFGSCGTVGTPNRLLYIDRNS